MLEMLNHTSTGFLIRKKLHHNITTLQQLDKMCVCFTGYGFVDFDSPAAAQKAVTALKSSGVQAQMAKVRDHFILYKLCNQTTMCFKVAVCSPEKIDYLTASW